MSHLHDLREVEVQQLEESLQHVRMTAQTTQAQLQAQIESINAERAADAAAYQSKILRLQAVQRAALTAGSARGRQLLYTESLRAPELHRASSVSWRGADWEGNALGEADPYPPEWLSPHPPLARSKSPVPASSFASLHPDSGLGSIRTPIKRSSSFTRSPPRTPRSKDLRLS